MRRARLNTTATEFVRRFENLNEKAKVYHNSAQWEEKLRVLQEALQICEKPDFPDATTRTQAVLVEISGIQRRLGRYDKGIKTLERRLQVDEHADGVSRAGIVGEMGTMFRHSNHYEKARDLFLQQYALASKGTSLEADAQMCQGIGNAGMANYNLAQQQDPPDKDLLDIVVKQLHNRVQRARKLHCRAQDEEPSSRYVKVSKVWETVGMNRLILCYILKGETYNAVSQAEDTLRHQNTEDPNVKAFTSFFCGYAFWADGQRDRALRSWSVPERTTTPAMALCKEASTENIEYLRLLADAGVDFESYDEQGSSALDFAVLSESPDAKVMVEIILDTFRKSLSERYKSSHAVFTVAERDEEISKEISMRHRQSLLRKEYRSIFQEQIRPAIADGKDAMSKIRRIYATLLKNDPGKRAVLDAFHFVKFTDFIALGRMPGESDRLAQRYEDTDHDGVSKDDQFIVFLSYRQLGMSSTPPRPAPDDIYHTQYKRMKSAIESLLAQKPEVDSQYVYLWLDCACINQIDRQERDRGINALPFAVAQCNAMISLVDDAYWTRAWCGAEVTLIRELQEAYKIHAWYEHRLHDQQADGISGFLQAGDTSVNVDVSTMNLANEELDRPKIDFLVRQSKLIGRDLG